VLEREWGNRVSRLPLYGGAPPGEARRSSLRSKVRPVEGAAVNEFAQRVVGSLPAGVRSVRTRFSIRKYSFWSYRLGEWMNSILYIKLTTIFGATLVVAGLWISFAAPDSPLWLLEIFGFVLMVTPATIFATKTHRLPRHLPSWVVASCLLLFDVGIFYAVSPESVVSTSGADSVGRLLGVCIALVGTVPFLVWAILLKAIAIHDPEMGFGVDER